MMSMLFCFIGGAIAGPVGMGVSYVGGMYLPQAGLNMAIGLQKAVWLSQLKDDYEQNPTWLDELPDLSMFVTDAQTLIFPEAGADPDVYKNKTTDIDSVTPSETSHEPSLDVYDSQNYLIKQATLHALSYDKIGYYTGKSAKAIRKKEAKDALHKLTPNEDGNRIIVLGTNGVEQNGLLLPCTDDVLKLAEMADTAGFPDEDKILVLPSVMWWGLVKNNEILTAQIKLQQAAGVINPNLVELYGWRIFKYNGDTSFNASTKKKAAQGAVVTGDIVPVGVGICKNEAFRASGEFNMAYTPFSQNPVKRAHEFGFQHRFLADFQRDAQKYSAAFYMTKKA